MATDDMELVRDYAARQSEPAFETLVARYVNLIYSAALRQVGDPHLAEEVTQAVFIILARKAGSLGAKTILPSWLHRTACYTAADALKIQRRRAQREQEAHMQSLLNEPENETWTQIAPLLDTAIAGLNEKDRHAIVLRFFEKKSMSEVGQAIGANENAAKTRVNRALEKLRKFFAKRGVTLSTTAIAGVVAANSVQAAPVGLAVTVTAVAAKGAAVSGSTLILIKGALKLMAWTKLKTAALVGAAVLLAGGTTTLVVKEISAQSYDQPTIDESLWKADNRILEKVPPVLIIRPTKFAGGGGGLDAGDRAIWMDASISTLLSVAYDFPESRLALPNNLSKEHFDLMLTLQDHPKETLKAEIRKRFGLVGHSQALATNMLLLKVRNTNAPGLKPIHGANATRYGADPAAPRNIPPGSDGRWMVFPNTTLALFVTDLEFKLKEKVRDQTGLTGHFEIQLQWQSKDGETENDSFKRAVLEQLGLDLVPSRESIEMVVVEKVK
jgi:uncharacterized protein (TIGR03435 family)